MKFTKEIMPDNQAKVVVDIDSKQYDEFKLKAARKISNRKIISGFRPGKAPFDVVRRYYGDDAIEEEALELMVHEIYPLILKEADLKPVGPGQLEEIINKNPPKLLFSIPLEPAVKLGKYKTIKLKYVAPSVEDKEIDQVLHRLQINHATAIPVDREIHEGDLVTIKLNARLTNPSKDENAEIIKDSPLQLVIGEPETKSNSFPYDGFEEELIGLKVKQEKRIKHTYPKNSNYEKLQNKEVEFIVVVEDIRELQKPPLNDDFAKTVGNHESFSALKEAIRKELLESKTREYDSNYYDDLINQLITISELHYPHQLLDDEIEHILRDFERNLATQNMDFITYLKLNNLEKEKFIEEEIKPIAKNRLEQHLVLDELQHQENIELEKDELQQAFAHSLTELQAGSDYQELRRRFTSKGLATSILTHTAAQLMNKHVLSRLKDIATGKVTEKEKTTKQTSTKRHQKSSEQSSKQSKKKG